MIGLMRENIMISGSVTAIATTVLRTILFFLPTSAVMKAPRNSDMMDRIGKLVINPVIIILSAS